MKVQYFATASLLFLLLGGQSLQPNLAYANCCPCTCMPWMCTCAGKVDPAQGYCYYCLSPDPVLQVNASIDKSAEQLRPVNESISSTVAKSDIIQRVMELRMGSSCFRNKVALSLLGDNRDSLKFALVHFNENAQHETLAFNVKE
jgi:hypothetical protein